MRRRFEKDWERIWRYKTKYPGKKESIFYRQPREIKINSREKICKRLGDAKHNSQELEKRE